jgi:hypothetical protein
MTAIKATNLNKQMESCLGSIPGRGKLYLNNIQTGSGAHPASYPIITRGSFPGNKAVWE